MHRNEQIVDMYRTGEFSLKKLGERFGLSHEGVRGILKRADVPINPVGLRVGYVSKFQPCAIQFKDDPRLEMCLKDCFTVWEPWGTEGVQIGKDESGEIVAIQIPGLLT